MSAGELGCSYAAMLLYSDDQEVTDEKIKQVLAAAGIECESYWPGLFVKALGDKENMTELLTTPGGGGGPGPAAAGGGKTPPSSPSATVSSSVGAKHGDQADSAGRARQGDGRQVQWEPSRPSCGSQGPGTRPGCDAVSGAERGGRFVSARDGPRRTVWIQSPTFSRLPSGSSLRQAPRSAIELRGGGSICLGLSAYTVASRGGEAGCRQGFRTGQRKAGCCCGGWCMGSLVRGWTQMACRAGLIIVAVVIIYLSLFAYRSRVPCVSQLLAVPRPRLPLRRSPRRRRRWRLPPTSSVTMATTIKQLVQHLEATPRFALNCYIQEVFVMQ